MEAANSCLPCQQLTHAGCSAAKFLRSSPTGFFAVSEIGDMAKYEANRDTFFAEFSAKQGIGSHWWAAAPARVMATVLMYKQF